LIKELKTLDDSWTFPSECKSNMVEFWSWNLKNCPTMPIRFGGLSELE
jgi:hypothetical protein